VCVYDKHLFFFSYEEYVENELGRLLYSLPLSAL
jgi:hypothetical protein